MLNGSSPQPACVPVGGQLRLPRHVRRGTLTLATPKFSDVIPVCNFVLANSWLNYLNDNFL